MVKTVKASFRPSIIKTPNVYKVYDSPADAKNNITITAIKKKKGEKLRLLMTEAV